MTNATFDGKGAELGAITSQASSEPASSQGAAQDSPCAASEGSKACGVERRLQSVGNLSCPSLTPAMIHAAEIAWERVDPSTCPSVVLLESVFQAMWQSAYGSEWQQTLRPDETLDAEVERQSI